MTKVAITLIVLFLLVGIFYTKVGSINQASAGKAREVVQEQCVVSTRDIPAFATIKAKDLEIRTLIRSNETRFALHTKGVALEKRTRQRISKGQILSVWDFEPVPHRVMFH